MRRLLSSLLLLATVAYADEFDEVIIRNSGLVNGNLVGSNAQHKLVNATPQPTSTPAPTPTPQAIPTAAPTWTAAPTVTPQPTATPVVFPTPAPTATAVATPTPYLAYDTVQDEGTPTTQWRILNCIGDLIACATDVVNSRTNLTVTNPTPLPTATVVPTATPIPPVATATPAPTATLVPTATPAPTATPSARTLVLWGASTGTLNTASTNYLQFGTGGLNGAVVFQGSFVVPDAGTVKNLYCVLSAAPNGAGKSYTMTVLKNGSATGAPNCQVANAATTCNDTSTTLSVAAGDTLGPIQCVPANTPTASQVKCGFEITTP
jgi:hypothetical protein